MICKKTTIQNAYGIHCRPSGIISQAVRGYQGRIIVRGPDGSEASPESVLSLLSLALANGDDVEIAVEGPDEEQKCDELLALFKIGRASCRERV